MRDPAGPLYVPVFIEHGTRRLHLGGVTPRPTGGVGGAAGLLVAKLGLRSIDVSGWSSRFRLPGGEVPPLPRSRRASFWVFPDYDETSRLVQLIIWVRERACQ
jgi:hypothetical protein